MIAFDRLPVGRRLMAGTAHALGRRAGLAFDRGSVRAYDRDGRLRVEIANISKATVNPYVGHEIPEWKALGLDPEKVYQLFRDPAELKKAVATANGIPILTEHVPVTADDHQPDIVVGATGTNASFESPFLRNSLVLWAKDGIDAVESGEQKELSCAYHYRADMTPGEFQGERYDGVMRDIVFNHVALVEEGRAGADVVVGDSMETILMAAKSKSMSTAAAISLGAVAAFIAPKLAKDAKLDITPAFDGLTAKNFKTKKAGVAASITKLTTGKLAQDASIDGVVELLDKLEQACDPAADPAAAIPGADDPVQLPNGSLPITTGMGPPYDNTMDADPMGRAKEFLKGKLSAEDMKAFDEFCAKKPGANDADETDEEKAAREKKEKEAKEKEAKDAAADPDKDEKVDKKAMDAAISTAVTAAIKTTRDEQKALREAEEFVRPWVGKLAMAHDSAAAVMRTAISSLGVNVDGVDQLPVPVLKAILSAQPKPGEKREKTQIAMDASSEADFAKRFPGAAAIKVL